jgi:hypothetical protein
VRASWFVERVVQGGTNLHWHAERLTLSEVLEDLLAAKATGDHFRFIAPWFASDDDLDVLLRGGAMPTFPAPEVSDVDVFLKELMSKNLKTVGGVS